VSVKIVGKTPRDPAVVWHSRPRLCGAGLPAVGGWATPTILTLSLRAEVNVDIVPVPQPPAAGAPSQAQPRAAVPHGSRA